MNIKPLLERLVFLPVMIFGGSFGSSADAADVDVRISSREAYVGQPIILQIMIRGAEDFDQPQIPDIDGCDIRSAGAPSKSSQVMIINGRRRESHSVMMRYAILPRRAGSFEIPAFSLMVNGKRFESEPIQFVATRSETGDLLFAEIEGREESVYVGEALKLTLKIWLKPYIDRERNIKLTEGNMWSMISDETVWGTFGDAFQDMAENNRRPGGTEVLRDNGEGQQQAYYLYEIDATIYPKRPGEIDAGNVQIVVDYPTGLGRSQDPFESLMGRDPFAGSPLSRMMQDDFFSSPFGNRLTVTGTRPITAEASADPTQVAPVPQEGRPADYQGAVGKYQIVTQASPTEVYAGDPITLQIGVVGTGPMELVQAPPLADYGPLTKDFKVEDQSLAGFVRNDTKVFPTTIRPRRAGITTVPPIPFSFFDPETETFQTVTSDPIEITVGEAESLAMDAIVGKAAGEKQNYPRERSSTLEPSFTNIESSSLLDSQSPTQRNNAWMTLVVGPPIVWFAILLVTRRATISTKWAALKNSFYSAETRCLRAIEKADERIEVELAMIRFIEATWRDRIEGNRLRAAGLLRASGLYSLAADLEVFFDRLDRHSQGEDENLPQQFRAEAAVLTNRIAVELKNKRKPRAQQVSESWVRTTTVLVLLSIGFNPALSSASAAAEPSDSKLQPSVVGRQVELDRRQQETILLEASDLYRQALMLSEEDRAEAGVLFQRAAAKYQMLVDSGILHSGLYFNLGNAYLKGNQFGRAIAAYERALKLDPANRQISANLRYVDSLVNERVSAGNAGENDDIFDQLHAFNQATIKLLGRSAIGWMFGISSLCFWGCLIGGLFADGFPANRLASAPLLVALLAGASIATDRAFTRENHPGVIVVNRLVLRSGDGEQFSEAANLDAADGQRIEVLGKRSGWSQVRTSQGQTGWIPDAAYVSVR